ncbi:hypothetical protein HOD38_01000 [archaeon]|jgi:hypothetical protein|nr:hypothetical protein [archaeon]MBT4396821.1 hypothetical protein [archaeon]MBT4441501.1 hypothetical protein [archaeon]
MNKRGQASTEMIIILGIALIVIAILVVNSQTTLFSVKDQYRENQARIAVDDIVSAAEFVYQQGLGAKTEVFVTLPSTMSHTNVTSDYISITFENGNSVVSSIDFNVTGSLPSDDGSYWIEVESRSSYVLISTNVSEISGYCGDGVCSAGENCPADVGGCTDNVCYDPTCVSGCGETAIVSAEDSGECDSTTLSGSCVDVPCVCDGSSICIDVVAGDSAPIITLINPENGVTNTSTNAIDFTFNVSDDGSVDNCSLFIDGVLNFTDEDVSMTLTENISVYLDNAAYTWNVNCTDNVSQTTNSGERSLTVEISNKIYIDLWELTSDLPYPLDFTSGLNSSGNTFWNAGADDGWDWRNGTFMGSPSNLDSCVTFGQDENIFFLVGDEGCGSADDLGQGSGAYGIKFYVDSDAYSVISGGGLANLSFLWAYTALTNELDNSENVWIKVTIGNGTIWSYEDFEGRYLGTSYQWVGGSGWKTDWAITGAGTKTMSTSEYSGIYAMYLYGGNTWVDRAVDLSSATNPQITFYAKCTGLESSDHAYFRVSPDDSTWYLLETWTDGDDDGVWREYSYDLSSYYDSSDEFWISYNTPDFNNANDKCYFDQIMIYEGSTSYLGSALDGAVNQGDVWNEIYWVNNPGSGVNAFNSYDVSSYITGEGWYYLSFGGQVYRWNAANEGAKFTFDNIMLYVEP